jgi:hypothetical protein
MLLSYLQHDGCIYFSLYFKTSHLLRLLQNIALAASDSRHLSMRTSRHLEVSSTDGVYYSGMTISWLSKITATSGIPTSGGQLNRWRLCVVLKNIYV